MRIGTWNLEQAAPAGPRGLAQARTLGSHQVELWLLTEVDRRLSLPGYSVALSSFSSARPGMSWAGVASSWPLQEIPAGHEGLALAAVMVDQLTALAAASVLPWRGAARYWPGDAAAPLHARFTATLNEHDAAIRQAQRQHGCDAVVWGGDFNQALSGPELAGSAAGRIELTRVFAAAGLRAATANAEHLLPGVASIDHVALPMAWGVTAVEVLRPEDDGRQLSDHAAYVVDT